MKRMITLAIGLFGLFLLIGCGNGDSSYLTDSDVDVSLIGPPTEELTSEELTSEELTSEELGNGDSSYLTDSDAGVSLDLPTEEEPTSDEFAVGFANIQFGYASDVLRAQYVTSHEFVHVEGASWMFFTTDVPVTDLEFFEVEFYEDGETTRIVQGEPLFTAPDLTPNTPFFVRTFTYWPDTGQRFGISFTGQYGVRRSILIFGSMENALGIAEFTPGMFSQEIIDYLDSRR